MAQKPAGVGPMIAVVVIVIILAIGGLYYLVEEVSRVRSGGAATAVNI